MNISHLVFRADSVTYMTTKALSSAGHNVHVYIGASEDKQAVLNKIKIRLLNIANVKVFSLGSDAKQSLTYDRLIIQVFPHPPFMAHNPEARALAKSAKRITLISAGDLSRFRRTAYELQWQELRTFGRWVLRIDRIVYKDGFHKFDLFSLFKSRRVLGFDVHSMFLDNKEQQAYIQNQNWLAETPRQYSTNFMGSQDPDRRKKIMDSIRPFYTVSNPLKKNYWQEYSDAQPAALELEAFVDVLTDSDFTLCPPGYSLITHRLIESLLRGSIPVLNTNELDIYDIGLKDGVNCIAVAPNNWPAAAQRCIEMGEDSIIQMRKNIANLVNEKLLYSFSSAKMRHQLSIP